MSKGWESFFLAVNNTVKKPTHYLPPQDQVLRYVYVSDSFDQAAPIRKLVVTEIWHQTDIA